MLKRTIIFVINAYKTTVSPLLGPHCRHYPSCSSYAVDAVEKFGPLKGLGMALMRILRCNGFFKGGFDPVNREVKPSAYFTVERVNVSRETLLAPGAGQK